jgi:hypothetical protein
MAAAPTKAAIVSCSRFKEIRMKMAMKMPVAIKKAALKTRDNTILGCRGYLTHPS